MELREFARQYPRAAVGFSGGVDSAYLLYAGLKEGADWHPVYIRSAFQPEFELEDAKRLCAMLGADLTILEADILSNPNVRSNPSDRCYYCKQVLFGLVAEWAREQGIPLVLDGNNASDPPEDRPGMRAAKELGVRSPLREAGLTKTMIRKLSREAGLFTWNKPAYACLATRVPVGSPIDAETLIKVDESEAALRKMGFSDFRVRIIQNAAKLQLTENQMGTAIEKREQILNVLKPFFSEVMLDLNVRPGVELPT
jgi:TIGR00268 family protein